MMPRLFRHPVHVFVGLGFPHEVRSVFEAYRVLEDCSGSRGSEHSEALAACRSALLRRENTEAARVAFENFARARGILAPEAIDVAAARHAEEWLGTWKP
jgi:SH3-like domain-containing protein